jgi:hypothetical protein
MNLKIRLPDGLDARLRAHSDNTGATLNSIICLAIDAFLPSPDMPVKVQEGVISASKQHPNPPPVLSSKPTKEERRKLAEWHLANQSGQIDLLKNK